MRRIAWAILVVGSFLGMTPRAYDQVIAPPQPSDLGGLAQRMRDEVRRLAEDIGEDLAQTPSGRYLLQDTRELDQTVDEFSTTAQATQDPYQLRQAYAGIDASWHHLQSQLGQSGVATPVLSRDVERISRIDAQLHQALNLNTLPTNYYGPGPAPTGILETRRLARALVDRAEALAATIRAEMVGSGGARLVQDAVNLAQAADAFHDGIVPNVDPGVVQNGFAGVAASSDLIRREMAEIPTPPRVQAAWQAYQAVEVLVRQALGLPNSPQALASSAIPASGPSPVVALADQLVQQVNAFLQVFSQTARAVPEGGLFLADAERLQAAVVNFRQAAAQGLNAGQLAFAFRDVDALWQRLARRTNRIARGRIGPNIQQIGNMGQTIAQIHQYLGIPGYAPVVGPFPTP